MKSFSLEALELYWFRQGLKQDYDDPTPENQSKLKETQCYEFAID